MIRRSPRRPSPLRPLRGAPRQQKYHASVLRPTKPYRATPEEWTQLRDELFERAQGFCEWPDCGKATPLAIGEAHHVISRAKGGGDLISNLRYSCRKCHRRHHGTVQWTVKGSKRDA